MCLSPAKVKDDLESLRRDLEQRLSNQVAQHTVSIQMGRDGLVISLREAGFFDSGSATPRAETLVTLRADRSLAGAHSLRSARRGAHRQFPIHTAEFDSNWELSSARATRIARIFSTFTRSRPTGSRPRDMPSFIRWPAMQRPEGRAQPIGAWISWFCRDARSIFSVPSFPAPAGPGARLPMETRYLPRLRQMLG